MDPTTALQNLIEALQASNFHAARESADALRGWHNGGGFLPRWPANVDDPSGPGAWHLGRMVAAIDLTSGSRRARARARIDYSRALAAIETLIYEHPESTMRREIAALVASLIPEIADDYRAPGDDESDEPSMGLTVATDDAGETWSYQTGDNSYTGGAYGLPHWAVVTLMRDSDPAEVTEEIFSQWEAIRYE